MRDPLDGNAAAGDLGEAFAVGTTVAIATCAHCGDARAVAELLAYMQAPGLVLRCRSCEGVEVRLVRGDGRTWLDLRGVRVIELQLPLT